MVRAVDHGVLTATATTASETLHGAAEGARTGIFKSIMYGALWVGLIAVGASLMFGAGATAIEGVRAAFTWSGLGGVVTSVMPAFGIGAAIGSLGGLIVSPVAALFTGGVGTAKGVMNGVERVGQEQGAYQMVRAQAAQMEMAAEGMRAQQMAMMNERRALEAQMMQMAIAQQRGPQMGPASASPLVRVDAPVAEIAAEKAALKLSDGASAGVASDKPSTKITGAQYMDRVAGTQQLQMA